MRSSLYIVPRVALRLVVVAGCGGVACGSNGEVPSAGSVRDASPVDTGVLDGTVAIEASPGNVADANEAGLEAEAQAACATQDDPHNCGVCGHDCAGGACSSGQCVSLPAGVLASGQRIPSGIAIDATSVYWVNEGEPNEGKGSGFFDGQLLACSKTGCGNAPTALASGLELTAIDRWLVPVAVAGGSVYWVASQKVLRCLTTGCNGNPTALWTGQQSAQSFALDTSNLYVALVTGPDQGSGEIAQCPLSGCGLTPLTLASSAVPFGIAVDAKNVYWIDSQARVLACAIGGCSGAPTVLVAGPAYAPIVASGSRLYWTNGASPVAGCAAGCSDAGAPLTTTTGSKAGGLAIDATNAYWTQPVDGLVLKCPLSGCATPTIVASGESGPAAIAVDDTNVYWTDSGSRGTDGMIRTAPK